LRNEEKKKNIVCEKRANRDINPFLGKRGDWQTATQRGRGVQYEEAKLWRSGPPWSVGKAIERESPSGARGDLKKLSGEEEGRNKSA